jgi:hypothetical protein
MTVESASTSSERYPMTSPGLGEKTWFLGRKTSVAICG